MFKTSRLHQPGWLSGAFHLVIIGVAVQADSPAVWPYALAAMSVVSFFAWAATYQRYRQIHDLPTSKVASAAQGYVELFGKSELLPGTPITCPLSRRVCCWYSYAVEEKDSNDKWQTIDRGTSSELFLLVDDTGQCIVSPEGAEVFTQDNRAWQEGRYRYNESLLLPRGIFYALGEFSTVSAAAVAASEERAEISETLNEWKADTQRLQERFDLNRDGMIDMKEWELARLQAQREVRKRRAETQSHAVEGIHRLRKPADGRLFLLANEMPDKLGSRYRVWSWAHLVVFIGAGSIGLFML